MHDKIHQIIAECLNIPLAVVDADLPFKETKSWDSLRHMELIGALEQAFEIEFTFDEIVSLETVSSVCRVLQEKGVRC